MKLERELPKTEILEPLPQHHLLRARRLRRAGRVEDLLRQERRRPHAARGRLPGRADPRARRLADANRADTDPQAEVQPRDRRSGGARRCSTPCCSRATSPRSSTTPRSRDDFADVLPRKQVENYGTIAHTDIGTQYFVELRRPVARRRRATSPTAEVRGGGLRVYTTLDYGMQADAVDAVHVDARTAPTDPAVGARRARHAGPRQGHVGGPRLRARSQVNLAAGADGGGRVVRPARRSRPFAVAEALQAGHRPGARPTTRRPRSPSRRPTPARTGSRRNDDDAGLRPGQPGQGHRPARSTPYFAQLVHGHRPRQPGVAGHAGMGVESPLNPVPSLVLGTSAVSPLDMASGYSTLHGQRRARRPRRRHPGHRRRAAGCSTTPPTKRTRVLDRRTSPTRSAGTSAASIANGTGTGAEFGQPAAGKTGTTEDHRDAWFVGYTCSLTASVWMGYPSTTEPDGQRPRQVRCSAAPSRRRSGASSWPRPPRGSRAARTTGPPTCPAAWATSPAAPAPTVRSGSTTTTGPTGSTTTSTTTPDSTTTTSRRRRPRPPQPATTTTTKPPLPP